MHTPNFAFLVTSFLQTGKRISPISKVGEEQLAFRNIIDRLYIKLQTLDIIRFNVFTNLINGVIEPMADAVSRQA